MNAPGGAAWATKERGHMTQSIREPLRVGFVGCGFIADFHRSAFAGVRNAQIAGAFDRSAERTAAFCAAVDKAGLGPCRGFASIGELAGSEDIDAVWLLTPNAFRVEHTAEICDAASKRPNKLAGIACEKPLARTLSEARRVVAAVEQAGLPTGYLENQVFAPAVRRAKEFVWSRAVPASGRPYLVRASEEHSGPHSKWFWDSEAQGGGALLDMMCHSIEVAHFLMREPGTHRSALTVESVLGSVDMLKWGSKRYQDDLRRRFGLSDDELSRVGEDYAHCTLKLRDATGARLIIEASTSWAFVGPGLKIEIGVQGPSYSLDLDTSRTDLNIFLARGTGGAQHEAFLEKQNAEEGLMPVVEDEAAVYGYTQEDQHMVRCFLAGAVPDETFADGLAVIELLMATYRSAELGQRVVLPSDGLETYRPQFRPD